MYIVKLVKKNDEVKTIKRFGDIAFFLEGIGRLESDLAAINLVNFFLKLNFCE